MIFIALEEDLVPIQQSHFELTVLCLVLWQGVQILLKDLDMGL